MEAEATIRNNQNHSERNAGDMIVEQTASTAQKTATMDIDAFVEKRKELLSDLNGIKADREAIQERLKQVEEQIQRTTGALMMLNGLIHEADPATARSIGIGGN